MRWVLPQPGGPKIVSLSDIGTPTRPIALPVLNFVLKPATGAGLRVVPAKDLLTESMKAAGKIAQKSAITTMIVKEAVNRAQETTLREGILFERRLFNAAFATEDQKEGMSAFLEKREPQFRDR